MFPVRSVVAGAFLPVFLFEMGVGAILPLIPAAAGQLGASLAIAGFLAALLPVGKIVANIPAGMLATRLGDQGAMLAASAIAAAAFIGAALAPVLPVLAVSILAVGAASSVFALARHSYLTEITPVARRSRVLSTLGGVHRIGLFVGPFAGALVLRLFGSRASFWLATATAVAAILVLLLVGRGATPDLPDAPAPLSPVRHGRRSHARPSIRQVFADHRALFATLGVAVVLVGATRGARQTVLPLWLEHLGLEPSVISVVFGISAAADMALFYPAGKVMDLWGRLWIGVPSMALMASALAVLPFTQTLATATGAAIALGLGNGLSSGILMTLGADVAPPAYRASFLGLWRLFQDSGDATGPLVLALAAGLGSLAAGIWVMAAVAAAGVGALGRWVPRWSPHANRTTRRRANLEAAPGAGPDR